MQRTEKAIGEPIGRADVANNEQLGNKTDAVAGYYDNTIWMLPRLPEYSSIPEDNDSHWSTIADERSALGYLARHLAGRSDSLTRIRIERSPVY